MHISRRAAVRPGTLVLVGLLAAAAGAAAVLAVRHQRLGEELHALKLESGVLHDRLATLQEQCNQRDLQILALTSERDSGLARLATFRKDAESDAASLAALRERVGGLETDAARLQSEINKAKAEGSLKTERLGELTRQLKETQARAEKASADLVHAGYRGDELALQVNKLQGKLQTSEASLRDALAAAAEHEKTITVLRTDLTAKLEALGAFRRLYLLLQEANADLLRELSARPRRSTSPWADWYRPSRDSDAARAAAAAR